MRVGFRVEGLPRVTNVPLKQRYDPQNLDIYRFKGTLPIIFIVTIIHTAITIITITVIITLGRLRVGVFVNLMKLALPRVECSRLTDRL